MYIRSEEDIFFLRENALLVSKTLAEISKRIKPGVTTKKLDLIAEEFIRDHGAEPGFKGYGGFPSTLCTSVNSQVVHGIPSDYYLRDGDIISVDCGTKYKGFYGDSAYTFGVGEISPLKNKLLNVTKESLFIGIENAFAGNRTGDIGSAIQKFVEGNGFSVVRELVGHGLGKSLHEKPEVPNYGRIGRGNKLKDGVVICIEPMINAGSRSIVIEKDGWTVSTVDKEPSAHFELTVLIRPEKCEILSTFDFVEQTLNIN